MTTTTNLDPTLARLMIEASIQAYNAYDAANPARCNLSNVKAPDGYDAIDSWTGLNTAAGTPGVVECFGVLFRSRAAPYSYLFAFRGPYALVDLLADVDFWTLQTFRTNSGQSPAGAKVAAGTWSLYSEQPPGGSMQAQLFRLLGKYAPTGIDRLLITGHSLGGALAQLFTLDLAYSEYKSIRVVHYNYASPRVGDAAFAGALNAVTPIVRVQNTYDLVPCAPPPLPFFPTYKHAGEPYLLAFYGEGASIGCGKFYRSSGGQLSTGARLCPAEQRRLRRPARRRQACFAGSGLSRRHRPCVPEARPGHGVLLVPVVSGRKWRPSRRVRRHEPQTIGLESSHLHGLPRR